MNYGYFDNENREYVITNPKTPAPWANYLGSPEYGAIISNNAGGYSFVKSGANGRIIRYVFNSFDQPGRYIYLRDNQSGDYWSASWQPVGKDLALYKSECHHGTAYTRMLADYAGIHSEALYYVPLGKTYEVWNLSVTNNDTKKRSLTVTGYAEFTNEGFYEQDMVNLQYSLFITRTIFEGNRIRQQVHGNIDSYYEELNPASDNENERFFGLAGTPVASCCGDKEHFLGRYHNYSNPVGVENGDLGGEMAYNENACGALSSVIELEPGETKVLAFVLGSKGNHAAKRILDSYADAKAACEKELKELKDYWHGKLNHFTVQTPSREFDTMINTWNAYNCFMTFIWSRAASFIYCGLRNGYGYRDTVQDIQGIIHLAPEMAVEQIRFMLSAQVDNGGGLPLVKYTHNAGHEDTPDDASYVKETGHPAYRADDALWLFPTIYKYVSESGNLAFMDEVIPYANKDEGTVYDHCKRAIDFSMKHLGPHGMPAGLHADWNDCLRLGANGESTFVAFQFYMAMSILRKFAEYKKDAEYIAFLDENQAKLSKVLDELCWNEDRFIRGFVEDGTVIGNRNDAEANMWLNPQSWSVISGFAKKEQAEKAMEQVYQRLNTDYGVVLLDPPYHAHSFDGMLAWVYNPGMKENGGIFSQTQGWVILAEALLGHGNRAFRYYLENSPAKQNEDADRRILEPYCYGQFTEGKASPHFGRSHVHWLTGTASTMMVGSVEGILGMRPDFYGLRIAPSIPSEWKGFTVDRVFRGKNLHIEVRNPNHGESGCVRMIVNGAEQNDNYIPADALKEDNTIVLYLS